ncbi:MAG: transcriptional regulator [Syntrophobacteraceae bacterium]
METLRRRIISLLSERELSAREISQFIGIREKEVYEHLPNIAQSLASRHKKLIALPFICRTCGYEFNERKRFTRPGRCPRCKGGHLEEPKFRVE